jgi:hypothetical protein
MRKNALPLTLAALAAGLLLASSLPEIEVRWDSKQLRIAGSNLRFLAAKSVERLRAGESVRYEFRVSLIDAEHRREESFVLEKMALSYDLWEEQYFTASLTRRGVSARSKTPQQAERWMMEQLPAPSADREKRYRLRVEVVRERAQKEEENGLNLTRLVEIFSRRTESEPDRWSAESREFRVRDLETKAK